MSLKILNKNGVELYRKWLDENKGKSTVDAPTFLLDKNSNVRVFESLTLSSFPKKFKTKKEMAMFFKNTLKEVEFKDSDEEVGFWTTMSIFYFDDICPIGKNGMRKIGAQARYFFDKKNHQRWYRHLIRTPYLLAREMEEHSSAFLASKIEEHGEMIEQTISRLRFFRQKGIRGLLYRLYFDQEKNQMKRGFSNRKKKRNS